MYKTFSAFLKNYNTFYFLPFLSKKGHVFLQHQAFWPQKAPKTVPKIQKLSHERLYFSPQNGVQMEKQSLINLIHYHYQQNDAAFREEARKIAQQFEAKGDSQLAEHIMAILSSTHPAAQTIVNDAQTVFLNNNGLSQELFHLPTAIEKDLAEVTNAISQNAGINKFLFQGPLGTGKTEAAKRIARNLERNLICVDSANVTNKENIHALFDEINHNSYSQKIIVLINEITPAILSGMVHINERTPVIATTSRFKNLPKLSVHRFNTIVDFDRYSPRFLTKVTDAILRHSLQEHNIPSRNIRLVKKILSKRQQIPYPGEFKKMLKNLQATNEPINGSNCVRKFYENLIGEIPTDLKQLKEQGFSVREIETITGISKSKVARSLGG